MNRIVISRSCPQECIDELTRLRVENEKYKEVLKFIATLYPELGNEMKLAAKHALGWE